MVGEKKSDNEIVIEKQGQENEPDVGTREKVVAQAENDVQQAHTVDNEIKLQDPDSQESNTSQELVDEADEKLENFKLQVETETDEAGEELGKEYEFEDEEFEKLKLFFGPIGDGKWNSALDAFLKKAGGNFGLLSADIRGYDVKELGESSIALLLILEDKKIKLTINFDHENKSINIGAKETITDLPESEIETGEAIEELDPELVRQFEEDIVTSQQEIEEEREQRREKWEDEDDKESAIEEEKNTIEQGLKERLIKENQNILEAEMSAGETENQDLSEQRNVQEILRSYEKIKNLRNSFEAEVNQEMTKREEISNSIQTSLTPENADLSQLNSIERDMLKKSTNDVLKTTKNVLSMKEIDYLMETMGSENNFGDLKGTHENRKIEMEKLQDTIDALDKFRELIEEFETLSERTLVEQREEVAQTVEGLEHIQKTNKKLFAALVAMGVVAGVVGLCLATGTPLPAFLTVKNAIIAGGAVAAAGTLAYLYKKDKLPSLKQSKEAAKFAIGLSLAGGFLAIDSLLNGEKVDEAFEFLCGTGLPSWAKSSVKK